MSSVFAESRGNVFAETGWWSAQGPRHVTPDVQKMQEETVVIESLWLLWICLASNFLSTIALFFQGNAYTQTGN
jgi:hypothetical protein